MNTAGRPTDDIINTDVLWPAPCRLPYSIFIYISKPSASKQGQLSLSSSRGRLMSSKLHQLVQQLFIQLWCPLANYAVKADVVCLQLKLCDPHLSALEVRFSRRGAILSTNLRLPSFTFTQLIPRTARDVHSLGKRLVCRAATASCRLQSCQMTGVTLRATDHIIIKTRCCLSVHTSQISLALV